MQVKARASARNDASMASREPPMDKAFDDTA
jgi:hypothetical protein